MGQGLVPSPPLGEDTGRHQAGCSQRSLHPAVRPEAESAPRAVQGFPPDLQTQGWPHWGTGRLGQRSFLRTHNSTPKVHSSLRHPEVPWRAPHPPFSRAGG